MHQFRDYICQQIEQKIKQHKVIVIYDEALDFLPFFHNDLNLSESSASKIKLASVGETEAQFIEYRGSFFEIRSAIEPIVKLDTPPPLVVYVPGISRDRQTSPLMEIEKAGTCYEPKLRRLALNVLRQRFSEGQIDEMLKPSKITYEDIAAYLKQGEQGQITSILRGIFAGAQSDTLLATWLSDSNKDDTIKEKEATQELFSLIEVSLGLKLECDISLGEARQRTTRYILINEFRSDLDGDQPKNIAMIEETSSSEGIDRIKKVTKIMRHGFSDQYEEIAKKIEVDLQLTNAGIEPANMGCIDTFQFEERSLLKYAGELICSKKYADARKIVTGRSRSFWIDRDVKRQAQWEACRLIADLGYEIDKVQSLLSKTNGNTRKWIRSYSEDQGWYLVDSLQRQLETWIAKMDEEPESERALAVVRQEHEQLLKKMATGFSKAFIGNKWSVDGVLHQTRIFPDIVEKMGGRVAYFFVDAMRFEMGVELAHQMANAADLEIRPAVAALPTITPVGMAALLPGSAADFNVKEYKGKLASEIEGTSMTGITERLRYLKAKVPGYCDLVLGNVLEVSGSKLKKKISDAPLVVVRSQEIDLIGESDGGFVARQLMTGIIGNIARAIRKLSAAGIENFVITADHGHQFSVRKEDDMKTDHPGGDTIDIHRRCWIGHGGSTPPGTTRVSGSDIGYETDLDFIFPTGLGVFKTGGGLTFHHGSISLQELIVPVISFRIPKEDESSPTDKSVILVNVPKAITNRTFGIQISREVEVFSSEDLEVRVVLVSGSEVVGETGMAIGADLNRSTGVLHISSGTKPNIGLMLTKDDCETVRIVIQDSKTDAVLDQSDELPVKLGI